MPLVAFMQVDTLVSLLRALTAFRYWKKKKKRKKEKNLHGNSVRRSETCSACDDITQTSSDNTDQRYLLAHPPLPLHYASQSKKEKKRKEKKREEMYWGMNHGMRHGESASECQMLKKANFYANVLDQWRN